MQTHLCTLLQDPKPLEIIWIFFVEVIQNNPYLGIPKQKEQMGVFWSHISYVSENLLLNKSYSLATFALIQIKFKF